MGSERDDDGGSEMGLDGNSCSGYAKVMSRFFLKIFANILENSVCSAFA